MPGLRGPRTQLPVPGRGASLDALQNHSGSGPGGAPDRLGLERLEGIEDLEPQRPEVGHISRGDGQTMHCRRCRDHCIFVERVRPSVHHSRPGPERRGIHRQNVVCACDRLQPCLDFAGFVRVLCSRQFDPCLNLAKGYSGKVELRVVEGLQPRNDAAVWALPAQFGNHIRVEQVPARHDNGSTERRFARPRSGTIKSLRA